jgi:soluble lytic murein transglycosylase-like protein
VSRVALGTGSPPAAAAGSVTSGQIGQVAAAHGVPASLAKAVAYQESGFNNGVVSSANARGVMQIIPSTWNFIQSQLSPGPLDPFSPLGNVHAGVLYLSYLLRHSGSESAAVASYYQGLRSVTRSGPLPETRHYVNNVLALQRRFGG